MDFDELSERWNALGRAYNRDYSSRLTRFYGDQDEDVELNRADPRDHVLADSVMAAVIDLNRLGQWQRVRQLFDPAHAPFIPWMQRNEDGSGSVAVLGPEEVLAYRGHAWEPDEGRAYHLKDGTSTLIADVQGFVRSRGRDVLAMARSHGVEIRDARSGLAGLTEDPIAVMPWPDPAIWRLNGMSPEMEKIWEEHHEEDDGFQVEQVVVSDDGMRVAVVCYRQGILLGSRHSGEQMWRVLWPSLEPQLHGGELDEYAIVAGDMLHVAMSPDGGRLAWGSQDCGHFLAEIGPDGIPQWYATVGRISEYPHHAAFSEDGSRVALNSCHFYSGGTVSFKWEGNRGVELNDYEVHDAAPIIDDALRLYAAGWIDETAVQKIDPSVNSGAFALAGSGVLRIASPDGALISAQTFGSSAGAIDVCPETRQMALSSYSGFVHLYDIDSPAAPEDIEGYRARREIARWVMWEELPNGPIRW